MKKVQDSMVNVRTTIA